MTDFFKRKAESLYVYVSDCDHDDKANFSIDPTTIPVGPNNPIIQKVNFTFGVNNYKVATLLMTDAEQERYQIPTSAVNDAGQNPSMRTEMYGLQVT